MFYIGEKLTLLCFSGLRSENQKTKKMNGVYQEAPLKVGKSVQNPKSREI
nr:MAG TPA: hypothetical protein [Caudoviricetes sp.]